MASTTSLSYINIKDEKSIITVKNIGKPSHGHFFKDLIEDHCYASTCIDLYGWYKDFFNYLKNGGVLIAFYHNVRVRHKKQATKYIILGDLLYRRSFDATLLRCLMRHEVEIALHQGHDDECGGIFNAKFVS